MIEALILGLIQGVAEWLPISSEGMIIIAKSNFFGGGALSDMISLALFLHLGTFCAALVYFRKDVARLLAHLFGREHDSHTRRLLVFLVIATIISGAIGFALLTIIDALEEEIAASTAYVNLGIAALLAITGIAQLHPRTEGLRTSGDLTYRDGLIAGIAQGFSILPGLSRSGLTVATLLMRKFQDDAALRLSFLMSLPVVLGANIVLNASTAVFSWYHLVAVLTSFISGYLTIHALFLVAKKIPFGYFVLFFAVLLALSALMP